jgi:hypothetical protein
LYANVPEHPARREATEYKSLRANLQPLQPIFAATRSARQHKIAPARNAEPAEGTKSFLLLFFKKEVLPLFSC